MQTNAQIYSNKILLKFNKEKNLIFAYDLKFLSFNFII